MQSETMYMKYISQKLGISPLLYAEIRRCTEEFLNERDDEQHIHYEHGIVNDREKKTPIPDDSLLGKFLSEV
jgi:hypothetical protein